MANQLQNYVFCPLCKTKIYVEKTDIDMNGIYMYIYGVVCDGYDCLFSRFNADKETLIQMTKIDKLFEAGSIEIKTT